MTTQQRYGILVLTKYWWLGVLVAHPSHVNNLDRRLSTTYTLSPHAKNGNLSSCYDRKTEILTPDGWIRFDALKQGVLVAQVDTATLEMSFVEPREYVQYRYTGPILHWEGKSADLFVTPDHHVVCLSEWTFDHVQRGMWKFQFASSLPARFYIPQAVKWTANDVSEVVFAGQTISGDDFVRFMGMWIAEGCTRESKHDVVISQDIGATEEQLWLMLQRLPFRFRRVPQVNREKHVQFKSSDRALYESLRCFGKSGDKYVPQEIKQMSSRQIQLFLDWYAMGDGNHSIRNHLRILYVSKSSRLIDDVQELLLRVGKTGAVQSYKACSRLEVRTHNKQEGKGYKWYGLLEPDHFKGELFDDDLFGIVVPTGALLLRRKHRTFVSGSCVAEGDTHVQEKFLTLFAETGHALSSMSQAGLDQALVSHWFQTDEQFRLRYQQITEQCTAKGRGIGKRFSVEQRQVLQDAFLQAFARIPDATVAMKTIGVVRSTLYQWLKTDEQFCSRYYQLRQMKQGEDE